MIDNIFLIVFCCLLTISLYFFYIFYWKNRQIVKSFKDNFPSDVFDENLGMQSALLGNYAKHLRLKVLLYVKFKGYDVVLARRLLVEGCKFEWAIIYSSEFSDKTLMSSFFGGVFDRHEVNRANLYDNVNKLDSLDFKKEKLRVLDYVEFDQVSNFSCARIGYFSSGSRINSVAKLLLEE